MTTRDQYAREIERIVDSWFVERFANRGYPVDLYNHLRRSADDLRARLLGALTVEEEMTDGNA
jgi:hypothetical protein